MTVIYLSRLDHEIEPKEFNKLLHLLTEEERSKILRMKDPCKASQSLLSQLIVRQWLVAETGLKNHEIHISRDSLGKPYEENLPEFHFNWSHSKDWIACAVSRSPVGIDIQQIKAFDPQLPQRYFSPKELQYIQEAPAGDQKERFFELWSLKEAYLKMLGIGIRVPLNSFSVILKGDSFLIEADKLDTSCHLYKPDCVKGYKLALCSRLPAPEYLCTILKPENIIAGAFDLFSPN